MPSRSTRIDFDQSTRSGERTNFKICAPHSSSRKVNLEERVTGNDVIDFYFSDLHKSHRQLQHHLSDNIFHITFFTVIHTHKSS